MTQVILSWKWWNEINNYGKGWKKSPTRKKVGEIPFTGYQLCQRSGLGFLLDSWGWKSSNWVVLDQPGSSRPTSQLKRCSSGVRWMCRASFTFSSLTLLALPSILVGGKALFSSGAHANQAIYIYIFWNKNHLFQSTYKNENRVMR